MKRLVSIIIAMLLSAAMFAQGVPQTVNFSATVRDANNELLANTPINVRLTFYEGGESGTPVYCALHQTTTNANGFMTFQLNRNVLAYACNGAPNTPFEEIPWENGNYWMHVEYQARIAGDFIDLGYLELTSGFYAFSSNYALIAQKLEGFDIDVTNAQNGDILVYNGATRKWEARRPENIGGGSTSVYAPTVTTSSATDVTASSATLCGNVISDGGAMVTERGFVYGTSSYDLSHSVQSGSSTGSFTANIAGLSSNTSYYYRAYATNSEGTGYGEFMYLQTGTNNDDYSEPTGYINGYGYVDLGLPSGIKWATCNVGASTPTDFGNYYAWGETITKDVYLWTTYRYYDSVGYITKYCNNAEYGHVYGNNYHFIDNLTTLETSDDAATANWGAGWRMPTIEEMNELYSSCTHEFCRMPDYWDGVLGIKFTGPNGNSIFLPATGYYNGSNLDGNGFSGYYWSSSLYADDPYVAWFLLFPDIDPYMYYYGRHLGLSVRPVCQSQN